MIVGEVIGTEVKKSARVRIQQTSRITLSVPVIGRSLDTRNLDIVIVILVKPSVATIVLLFLQAPALGSAVRGQVRARQSANRRLVFFSSRYDRFSPPSFPPPPSPQPPTYHTLLQQYSVFTPRRRHLPSHRRRRGRPPTTLPRIAGAVDDDDKNIITIS